MKDRKKEIGGRQEEKVEEEEKVGVKRVWTRRVSK